MLTSVLSIACCIWLWCYFLKQVRPLSSNRLFQISFPGDETTKSLRNLQRNSDVRTHPFNIRGNDIMIFLHIPKTSGGHFSKRLVKNVQLERACIPPVKG